MELLSSPMLEFCVKNRATSWKVGRFNKLYLRIMYVCFWFSKFAPVEMLLKNATGFRWRMLFRKVYF